MAIINKSQTDKQSKDYWRTPQELIDDALKLIGAKGFDVDVCCSNEDTKIPKSYWCLLENQDALGDDMDWFSDNYPECSGPIFATSFCNPPFSKKWEFFKKAVKQVEKWGKSILMVFPYTPVTTAWVKNVHRQDCIIYVPDGRYQYLLPDGNKPVNSCNFETCLILIVPFKCGNVIVNYKRGVNHD